MHVIERFLEKVSPEPNSGCWLWDGAINAAGYGSFMLDGKPQKAHRVAYELFKGPIVPLDGADCRGTCVIHSCDVPICVNPDHLRLGTHLDNMDDKRARDRFVSNPLFGEKHQNSKLKAAQIPTIRARHAAGETQHKIARDHGVTQATIRDVVIRRTWAHIE